jgi:hypothetical protein
MLHVVQTMTDNTTRLAKSLVTLKELAFMTIPSIQRSTVNSSLGMSDSRILQSMSLPTYDMTTRTMTTAEERKPEMHRTVKMVHQVNTSK